MSIFDILLRPFGFTKAAPHPGQLIPGGHSQNMGMIPTYPMTHPGYGDMSSGHQAPPSLAPEARARLAVQSAWVFSDIQLIAQEIATASLRIVERTAGSEEPRQVINHPFEVMWANPNPFFSRSLLMQLWAWFLCLQGESYLFFAPAGNDLAEIWPVPAWSMKPRAHPDTFIDGYEFRLRPDAKPIFIDARYISYSRLPNVFDIRRGMSPLEAAMLGIQTDDAQKRWNWRWFDKENAMPTNIVSLPSGTSNGDFERFRSELFDFYGGGQRRTMVARGGEIDFKALAVSQKEMDFIASRSFTRDEIDRALGIPGGFWNASATEANQRGAKGVVIENAVWPKLMLLAEDMTTQIITTWYGDNVSAAFDDIRPRNIELDIRERQSNESAWSVNELRKAQGKAPFEGAIWETLPAKVALQIYGTAGAAATPTGSAEPVARADHLEDTDDVAGDTAPGGRTSPKGAAAKAVQPILGYHIEQGVVTRNEARATLGLAAKGDEEQDVRLKNLQAVLGVVATATSVGIPLEQALDMVGLQVNLPAPKSAPAAPPPAAAAPTDKTEELAKWERKAIKALKAQRSPATPFTSDALAIDEQAKIGEALATCTTIAAIKTVFAAYKAEGLLPTEQPLYDALLPIFGTFTKAVVEAILAGEDVDYDSLGSLLSTILLPSIVEAVLARMAVLAAEMGTSVDLAEMTAAVTEWATPYVAKRIAGITKNTKTLVEQVIRRYRTTTGMTRADVEQALSGIVAPHRIEQVTIDAITEASAQAALKYQIYLADNGIITVRVWHTNADDLVCKVCGPLNGQLEEDWIDFFPAGPGAHPRCRCFVTLKVVTA